MNTQWTFFAVLYTKWTFFGFFLILSSKQGRVRGGGLKYEMDDVARLERVVKWNEIKKLERLVNAGGEK